VLVKVSIYCEITQLIYIYILKGPFQAPLFFRGFFFLAPEEPVCLSYFWFQDTVPRPSCVGINEARLRSEAGNRRELGSLFREL
jgi:hypothetical protein